MMEAEPEGVEVVEEIESEEVPEQIEADEEASTGAEEEPLEAEEEAPAEEAEAPPPEPATSEEAGQPFSFRADGKGVDVPGAGIYDHVDAEGNPAQSLVIPADSWQRFIQPHLADRGAFAAERRNYEQQIEALDPSNNETVVRAQSLLDNFEQIISSPEALTEFLENFDQNKELLKLKADLASRSAQDELRTSREEQQSSAEQQAAVYQHIDTDIRESASAVFDALQLDVSDEHKQRIGERVWQRRHDFYRLATAEDAANHPGVTVGEVVFDTDLAADEMQYLASFAPAQNTETEKARQKNKQALNKQALPTTIPADGSPAPSKEKVVEYKTREEWEEAMGIN